MVESITQKSDLQPVTKRVKLLLAGSSLQSQNGFLIILSYIDYRQKIKNLTYRLNSKGAHWYEAMVKNSPSFIDNWRLTFPSENAWVDSGPQYSMNMKHLNEVYITEFRIADNNESLQQVKANHEDTRIIISEFVIDYREPAV